MVSPTLEEYQIGWICALPIEAAAAQEMLDESFGTLEEQDSTDTNIYILGRIGKHLVVIACLGGQYGTTSATTVANNMMRTFSKSLRIGLMVGIGGGIPSAAHDIRLGDIVVSYPTGTCGGVVQHDMGKVGEATCDGCPAEWEVERDKRDDNESQLYYGVIASGNVVVKDGETREHLRKETCALCFEMEAAGLMQDFPCIVIRGICDYADSHKNKQWQGYAALAAASYAKELLSYVPRGQVSQEKLVTEICTIISQQLKIVNNTTDNINQKITLDRLKIAEGAAFDSYANQHEKCLPGTRRELLDHIERPELPIRLGFKQIAGNHQNMDLHEIPTPIIERDISLYFNDKLSQLREEHSLPTHWPRHDHIKSLVDRAVPLFIAAATICRFIGESWNPQERLEAILSDQTIYIPGMARTYVPVLKQLLLGQDEWETKELIEDFRRIVGVIIILATPLSINALSKLLFRKPKDLSYRLRQLHSVLNLVDNLHTPVRTLHLSFRNFLVDLKTKQAKESEEFWIDEKAIHNTLIDHCLGIMDHGLKKNICNLSSDGTQRSEIDPQCIERHLPPELRYACRYWVEHLSLCQNPFTENSVTREIFKNQLTNWNQLPRVKEEWSAEVQTLEGHSGSVWSVTFSPDSQLLASGSGDGTIKLWDPSTGELCQTLKGHSALVQSVTFSPDGQLLASGSGDGTIKLWDPSTGKLCQTLKGHSALVQSVTFSPDGQLLASGSNDRTIRLWDPSTGELRQTLKGHSSWVQSVAFSPNGRLLASGSADCTIRLWDPSTGELYQALEGHSSSVKSVTFSPDGQLLASGSDDRMIRLWDPSTGKVRRIRRGHSGWVQSVTFSPDGQLLASGSDDHTIILWDPSPGLRQALKGHSSSVKSVTFSPDGRLLASSSDDNTIKLWDPSTGELRQTLKGHFRSVLSVTFSPDGQLLASGSADKTIKLWDPSTGELRQTLKGHSGWVQSVAFSPNGRLLASGSADCTIRLWDPSTGELRQTLKGHFRSVLSVTFSPDGQLLASGSNDRTIRLWDPSTGELRQTLKGHSSWVQSVAFSPNGRLLASGSADCTIRLWDPSTGELYQALEGHSSSVKPVTFSPDGQLLASSSGDRTIRLNPSTGELRQTLECHSYWVWDKEDANVSIQDHQWICLQGKRVLWLPTEYRAICLAFKHSVLALGHANGRVSFMSYNDYLLA
ncbi:uncharacterized protein ATNIH1004_011648 [Aspergillus tanneri]|uniref:Nucleoside phosphorylase domain-containing protein n=1 Tax=Aspergillus tanneri TaxID=1220188 RepID=A0A5M9M398_9EURO|nr:uncharacterized protein ATNIH1004_011648 [Aspergillus tanneri]KAA8641512.1 hypothetical protein ATNIH1004_011648 [Aspergillus tanneri]